MRKTSRLMGVVLASLTLGCAEKAPPTGVLVPTPPADSPVTVAPVEQLDSPETKKTAKPQASQVPSEIPVLPEIMPEDEDESTAETVIEPETPFTLEDGFTGLSLEDFDTFQAEPQTWTGTDDGLFCTGKPKGYLYSHAGYQNFTWRLEYRFERPKSLKDDAKFNGNTGFLVYISGEHKQWPVCLEVQGKHLEMAAIKANGGAAPVIVNDDASARAVARQPAGRWNRLDIVSRDGALTVKLNDTLISRSEPNFLSEGKIGIQAEDHPFTVRRMRIRAD